MDVRTKYIDITFPNGEKWRVNAYPIAKECAEFNIKTYKTVLDLAQYDIEVNDDIDYLLSSEGFDDLIDYMTNFSDWNNLDKSQVKTEGFPDHEGWLCSGNFISRAVIEL